MCRQVGHFGDSPTRGERDRLFQTLIVEIVELVRICSGNFARQIVIMSHCAAKTFENGNNKSTLYSQMSWRKTNRKRV